MRSASTFLIYSTVKLPGKEGFCSLLDFFVLPDIIIAYKLLLLY